MIAIPGERAIMEGMVKSGSSINTDQLFKELFTNLFVGLHAYAFSILKDDEEAKDLVQSAFIKLWEKRGSVDLNASKAYLYTTVYHSSLNRIRDQKKRQNIRYLNAGDEAVVENKTETKEFNLAMNRAIESLPPKCREVFLKSRLEGKKYSEIATERNISVKTVEAQMGKALKILRDALADLNENPGLMLILVHSLVFLL